MQISLFNASGKFSQRFSFSTMSSVTALLPNILSSSFTSKFYTLYSIMTFLLEKNLSIHSVCHRKWAQVYPVSTDRPSGVSTWLQSTCGKFSWLVVICKGTHLSVIGPIVNGVYQSTDQATKSKEGSQRQEAQIWGKLQKSCYSIEDPSELRGLRHP